MNKPHHPPINALKQAHAAGNAVMPNQSVKSAEEDQSGKTGQAAQGSPVAAGAPAPQAKPKPAMTKARRSVSPNMAPGFHPTQKFIEDNGEG
jgi:hypothetical protein